MLFSILLRVPSYKYLDPGFHVFLIGTSKKDPKEIKQSEAGLQALMFLTEGKWEQQ